MLLLLSPVWVSVGPSLLLALRDGSSPDNTEQ